MKKNPINMLTLLSKYVLVGWKILCRVNSVAAVLWATMFYVAVLKIILKLKTFIQMTSVLVFEAQHFVV